MGDASEVLFIGGRSGAGKSSVANTMHARLSDAEIMHALIEGDNLDLAWPPPWEHGLAAQNLASIWANYRALGYRRLIYTNTVSVLMMDVLAAAMGDDPRVTAVLLTASDANAVERLTVRESGSELASHVERSALRARELHDGAPASVHRVSTDERTVDEVVVEVLALTGWAGGSRVRD